MPIHLLPPEVASQIAAGEVVERPASVVKELLENSLDAGASHISITIEDAGQRLVEVADDGSGIPPEELLLAVERHATSKLENATDLFHIHTLGFRGEALASIGSVSRMTVTSRPTNAEAGARLRVEGGIAAPLEPVGAPVGTIIRVEDLFYNVPARRKFLKHDTTERRQIDSLVTRYAMAYPEVRFHLRQEGRPSLQTSGNGNRREVLAVLYGVETARQMLEVISHDDALNVSGFISPPSLSRSNRREITIFVNGRPVQDATLVAALLKGYHTLLMVGRYPLAVLFLEVPVEAVDVNVHPAKAEVRFREPDRVFTALQSAVRRALLAHTPVPGLDGGVAGGLRWTAGREAGGEKPERPEGSPIWGWEDEARQIEAERQAGQSPETAPPAGQSGSLFPAGSLGGVGSAGETAPPGAPGAAPTPPRSTAATPILRLVGQIATSYLVAEGPDGLYLIDQHAAHERVLFERFMAEWAARHTGSDAGGASGAGEPARGLPAQALLQPVTVELPPASARLLNDQLPILAGLGFQVESFGPNTFLVRAIPALLSGTDPAAALRVLVEDFEEDETPLQSRVEAKIIARVCKRAAVKAGQTLSPEEQRALLHDLEACQSPRTCPHGRPTMIHLSVDLLERQFGRKGAR